MMIILDICIVLIPLGKVLNITLAGSGKCSQRSRNFWYPFNTWAESGKCILMSYQRTSLPHQYSNHMIHSLTTNPLLAFLNSFLPGLYAIANE